MSEVMDGRELVIPLTECVDAFEGGQSVLVVLAVSVQSEHHARTAQANVHTFAPESRPVLLD